MPLSHWSGEDKCIYEAKGCPLPIIPFQSPHLGKPSHPLVLKRDNIPPLKSCSLSWEFKFGSWGYWFRFCWCLNGNIPQCRLKGKCILDQRELARNREQIFTSREKQMRDHVVLDSECWWLACSFKRPDCWSCLWVPGHVPLFFQ